MKFNKKQILFSLLLIGVGIFLAVFGAVSSGAGHGPFPRVSIAIALFGLLISGFSFIFLIVVVVFGFLGREVFPNQTNAILGYLLIIGVALNVIMSS